MQALSGLLNRISNWKTLIGCLAACLFLLVLFRNAEIKIKALAHNNNGLIDTTFGFNPDTTMNRVKEYGDAGRNYYAQVLMSMDFIFPVVYVLLFAIILTLIYKRVWNGPVHKIHLLPFLCIPLDYVENIFIITMLRTYPAESCFLAVCCEWFKLLKWACLIITLVLVLTGLARLLFKRFSSGVSRAN